MIPRTAFSLLMHYWRMTLHHFLLFLLFFLLFFGLVDFLIRKIHEPGVFLHILTLGGFGHKFLFYGC
jgi:hypothetical protein